MSSTTTCHSRWCIFGYNSTYTPTWQDPKCVNFTAELLNYFTTEYYLNYEDYNRNYACCKLYCGQSSQFLQLQCQGVSERMAIVTWVTVLTLMLFGVLFLVSVMIERGGRKMALLGAALFLSFTSLVASEFASNMTVLDTPLYPIIGAMNVAAFSYLFAGYQYSISLVYELTCATTLIFTMFSVWSLLTIDLPNLIENAGVAQTASDPHLVSNNVQKDSVATAGKLAVAMLCVTITWVIHSSLFRTVGYRAAWIGAYENQKQESAESRENGTEPKKLMCKLWILAAADGHPTWRTREGQGMGLYLTALSWGVLFSSKTYLDNTCKEDLILFQIMMWFPPIFLTLLLLGTQYATFARETRCPTQYNFFKGQKRVEIIRLYTEAMIIYRLGKRSMDVNKNNKRRYLKLGKIHVDKLLATTIYSIEFSFFIVTSPGYLVIRFLHWLGRTMWPCGKCCLCHILGLRMKKIAFKISSDYCGVESDLYEDEINDSVIEDKIQTRVCTLLGQLDKIDLPLLLDNINPSCLSYLLDELVHVISGVGHMSSKLNNVERGQGNPERDSASGSSSRSVEDVQPTNERSIPTISPILPPKYTSPREQNCRSTATQMTQSIFEPRVVQNTGEGDLSININPLAEEQPKDEDQPNVPGLRKRMSQKKDQKLVDPMESNKIEIEAPGASSLFLGKH